MSESPAAKRTKLVVGDVCAETVGAKDVGQQKARLEGSDTPMQAAEPAIASDKPTTAPADPAVPTTYSSAAVQAEPAVAPAVTATATPTAGQPAANKPSSVPVTATQAGKPATAVATNNIVSAEAAAADANNSEELPPPPVRAAAAPTAAVTSNSTEPAAAATESAGTEAKYRGKRFKVVIFMAYVGAGYHVSCCAMSLLCQA